MTDKELELAENQILSTIRTITGDKIPDPDEFKVAADKARTVYGMITGYLLTDAEYDTIITSIRGYFTVQMAGTEAFIEEPHTSWLYDIKAKNDWFFWTRYKKYLENNKHWSSSLVAALDDTSNKILDMLGNPQSDEIFKRRGLIIGEVQSGKTANYTAICNKAADVGYNVIIVLTGMLEDLRKQTQERLDSEFAGRKSQIFLSDQSDTIKNKPIGVAIYGTKKRIPQFTSTIGDFKKDVLLSQNLDVRDLNGTILFVVKKNKNVLENLIDYLKNSIDYGKTQIERSLLLIDDEADNASINTNEEDEAPTTINRCIREILTKFRQTTYIGITATPFANIFINPDSEAEMLGDDLFPKDFIYALDVPQNYIGPAAIFDEDGKFKDMLVRFEPEEYPDVEEIFPRGHKRGLQVDRLPQSLYDAMNYFLLVNAVRDKLDDKKTHRTMLIHVSRFVKVHQQIFDLVRTWLSKVVDDLRAYAALPAVDADRNSKYISSLHKIFDRFDLEKICEIDWENFLHKYLREAVEPVQVGLRNSSGEHTFEYSQAPNGLRAIAIGGNSFSRGLTLEGLCVTYFYRHSRAYDTLMQMGRWFGYRPQYATLCKIWTSSEIIDWYGYITDVSNELRDEISIMQQCHMTPSNFGLKVRQHPGALMITAANKIRSGQSATRPVSLDRIFLETPRLIDDAEILNANKNLVVDFINSLSRDLIVKGVNGKNFWRGVPKQKIAEFIIKFQTYQWQQDFQSQPLGKYISTKMDDTLWDVIIPEGEGNVFSELNFPINPIVRKILVDDGQIKIGGNRLRISRSEGARNTLSEDEIVRAEAEYRSLPGKQDKRTLPDRAYMIYGRNPLLVLYLIEPKDKPAGVPNVVFALGVGFPALSPDGVASNVETADYVVNSVGAQNLGTTGNWDEDIEE